MKGLRVGLGLSGSGRGGGAGPVPTPLPALANLVGDWDTTTLPIVANGTQVSSITDSVSGQVLSQTPGSACPTYLNNKYNGKSGLVFNGSQYLFGAASASISAINAGSFPMLLAYSDVTSTPFGYLFNATDSTGLNIVSGSSNFSNGTGIIPGGITLPNYVPTRFTVSGVTRAANYYGLTNAVHSWIDGSNIAPYFTGSFTGTQIGIGATRTGIGGGKFTFRRALIWNRKLTQLEMWQAVRSLNDDAGQSSPLTATGSILLVPGDSISAGYLAPLTANLACSIAQKYGWARGSWTSLSLIGAAPPLLTTMLQGELSGGTALSVAGVPLRSTYFEFYNQKSVGLATQVAQTQTMLNAIYAGGGAGTKVVFGTTTDYANRGVEKATYASFWDSPANRAGYMDQYYPIHLDINIGVDNACANAAPYGQYFANAANASAANVNATTTTGLNTLTINSGAGIAINQLVPTALGVPAGTYIVSGAVPNFIMSANSTTGTTVGSLQFLGGDGVHLGAFGGNGGYDALATGFKAKLDLL